MKSLVLGFALAIAFAGANVANAAFLTSGSSTAGGNTINWAVEDLGGSFAYYYQIDAPVLAQTTSMVISGAFSGGTITVDDTIGATSIVTAANSTQHKNNLVFTPFVEVGISGYQVGSRPTELITGFSTQSYAMGTGTITVNGVSHSFAAPVPVPVPPALALVLGGLPFARLLRRKFSGA